MVVRVSHGHGCKGVPTGCQGLTFARVFLMATRLSNGLQALYNGG